MTLLWGCNTGTPYFWSRPAASVMVEGVAFDVRQRGFRVEAVRRSFLATPDKHRIILQAAEAIHQVTQCRNIAITKADPSVIEGHLRCGFN
ncbi:MAG: hypothetical protein VW387_00020 [Paracoccaceae bacterium]